MDITQLILDDDGEQRRLFAILEQIDDADQSTLAAAWSRLAASSSCTRRAKKKRSIPR